jgi:hypothetical protein
LYIYQGIVIQNSYDIGGDRGPSDFNAASRTTMSGIYHLPFHGNRFKDVEATQTGNPLNFHLAMPRSRVRRYCGPTSPIR